MKLHFWLLGVVMVTNTLLAASLPVITTHPQSQTVAQGGDATLSVVASGAAGYQWRFNGADISGATNSTLQITNAQATNGYYMVVAKGDTGWVPSQLVYLSINFTTGGTVPFSNSGNSWAQANYPWGVCNIYSPTPITNGIAQVVAGPQLDQMLPVGTAKQVNNGYFSPNIGNRTVPTVAPGQTAYYRVDVTYTNCNGVSSTQQSTVLKVVTSSPVNTTSNLYFPIWIEWPNDPFPGFPFSPFNQVRVLGERFSITNEFIGYTDLGVPTFQWRKDGTNITTPENFIGGPGSYGHAVLTITNAQASDAGVYDVVVFGNNWFIGPKTSVSIQLVNGSGVFQVPRLSGSNFVCDLVGAPTRNYVIECSTNLLSWINLLTLSNITGTVTFSNSLDIAGSRFFRARLLP